MSLQDNASHNPNTPPLPLRAPKVSPRTSDFEVEITLRTQAILRAFMRQIKVTRHECEIDSLIRQVCVRFAYDGRGINMLPVTWRPDFNFPDHVWWPCLRYQLVGLVHTYYTAVKEHELKLYEANASRLEEMLDKGIKLYLLSPGSPAGYVLRTRVEWNEIEAERERRAQEIRDNEDRIAQARYDDESGR